MASTFKSYSNPTEKQKLTLMLQTKVRDLMMEVASDEVYMAEIVAGGIEKWRQVVTESFAPYPMGDVPEMTFRFFSLKIVQLFRDEATRAQVEAQVGEAKKMAGDFLDAVEPVTPPTDKEIAAAWDIEDASSEDGKKLLYGDLHPKEYLDRLVTEKEPT